MHNPRGNTAPRIGSPLPQQGAGGGATPVRLVGGFFSQLPTKSRLFFQRAFFASYPRPIQVAGTPPFPRAVPIARIQVPGDQVIVFRDVRFQAYMHSGGDVEDIVQVPESRVATYIGYQFSLGNQGLTDFGTNLPTSGVPVVLTPTQGGATAPISGQGKTYPFSGSITPRVPGEQFAAYGRPGDLVQAEAVVLRPPNFDTRLFSVEMDGWIVNSMEMDKILDSLR